MNKWLTAVSSFVFGLALGAILAPWPNITD
jgi:hypothetical protein